MTSALDESRIEDARARAAATWPGVEVTAQRLCEFLGDRTSHADDVRLDLVLACACLDGQPAALAVFEHQLLAPVAARLQRMGGDVADEVVSRLRETLFVAPAGTNPKLASYSGRGDLRGWLEIVATREAYKVARRDRPALTDEHILASLPDDDDLELRHIKAQHRSELSRAFADALAMLVPRDRVLLRQRYLDDLSFDDMAGLHGAHRITVMRWLAKIENALLRDIRERLIARLGLQTAEVESLVDDARSRLDISLRGLLGTGSFQ
ncbi:MAG: hypothetical protein AB7O24_26890 [Kofleriaceae bacterium]